MVNEREILSIIDQMRISIPEDIREARRVLREREQIPQAAQTEADQIVATARQQAEAMIGDEEIVRQASSARTRSCRNRKRWIERPGQRLTCMRLTCCKTWSGVWVLI